MCIWSTINQIESTPNNNNQPKEKDMLKKFNEISRRAYMVRDGRREGDLTTIRVLDDGWVYDDKFLTDRGDRELSLAGKETLTSPDGRVVVSRAYSGGVPGGWKTLNEGGLGLGQVVRALRVFLARGEGALRTPKFASHGDYWYVTVDGTASGSGPFIETLWYKDVPVHIVAYTVEVYE